MPNTVRQDLICKALTDFGFSVTRPVAGIETAFSGRFGSGKPVIGILGEFDALLRPQPAGGSCRKETPSPRQCGTWLRPQPFGSGFPCGGSCRQGVFGTGKMFRHRRLLRLPWGGGRLGQGLHGRDGVFDELDCAITWHPWDINGASYEESLANYQIAYRFKGISSHAAASPHLGRSALDAVELMNVGVQFLREHVIDSARIHYAITDAGGFSPNVVQPQAEVLYLIRAPKNRQVQEIFERINKIAQGAALMTETAMEYDFIKSCSNMIPNYRLCRLLHEKMSEIAPPSYTADEVTFAKTIQKSFENSANPYEDQLGRYTKEDADFLKAQFGKPLFDFIAPLAQRIGALGGSTDVGDVSWVCPTAQILTTTKAALTPAHSWQQTAQGKSGIAHKGMLYAGKVMAAAAIELIASPGIVEEAKREHRESLGGETYRCAIPRDVRPRALAPK